MDHIKGVLLDIEGTVCSISFVKEVLFPYALESLPSVVDEQWDSEPFTSYRDAFPAEATTSKEAFIDHFRELVAKDSKIAYLKGLQGYLWKQAYVSGAIKAPLYTDVVPSITTWVAHGITVAIYSSGSVPAQKLFFQYTDNPGQPDITPHLSYYFDTINAGPKTVAPSYEAIARETKLPADQWLFLSDNVKEVEAAKAAGMDSTIVVRDGNAPLSKLDKEGHKFIKSFAELGIV